MKSNTEIAIQVSWISILSNLCLAALKWVVGYFGNSYALIADAIESTGDIFLRYLFYLESSMHIDHRIKIIHMVMVDWNH